MTWTVWGNNESRFEDNFFLKNKKYHSNDVEYVLDKIINHTQKNKIKFISLDKVDENESIECLLCFDMPKVNTNYINRVKNIKKKILFICECEAVHPDNFNRNYYKYFDLVFTYKDDQVDNKFFFKYYDGNNNAPIKKKITKRKKLVCMIAQNKIINYHKTIFGKRLECIKWFSNNDPKNFDLWGYNWNKRFFPSKYKIFRVINRVDFLTRLLSYNFVSYRGEIKPSLHFKIKVLQNYKFSIIYENSIDRGWITEKIFHCFYSGTVPIYLGCPNIQKKIPKNCFIDLRDFKSFDELCIFLKKINNIKFEKYQKNIKSFLSGSKYKKFTSEYNFKRVINKI
jgi:hypothetical protein